MAGSIVTLVLLVLLVAGGTSPAHAIVRGAAENGQGPHQQHGGDHDRRPVHGRQGRGGADDHDRDRDRDRRGGGRQRERGEASGPGEGRMSPNSVSDRDEGGDRDGPERDDRDRDGPDRDHDDHDDHDADRGDSRPEGREQPKRADRDRAREVPRPGGDEAEADDREGRREDRPGRGPSEGRAGRSTSPRAARATPRSAGDGSTDPRPSRVVAGGQADGTAAPGGDSTTVPDGDDPSANGRSDTTSPPDPDDLRTMGLGGYLAGDFGWFDRGPGRGSFRVPGGRLPSTVGGLPVLLALLGAFLALQRGIGQGLGHVPMDATRTEPDAHGQD